MARCDVCGNDYDKSFEVRVAGNAYTFDSLECAAQRVAPACQHCGCRILGHGVEQEGHLFCCAHCARAAGKRDVRDRVDARA
ncbi:MAG: hypothetical protein FWD17_10925 [Polyangiaceae bacterium]|nr:hypothetical protein [Polyangiaceae bacterium]